MLFLVWVLLAGLEVTLSAPLDRKTCSIRYAGQDIQGYPMEGACRFSVRYGTVAGRWAESAATTYISNASTTALPPSCPQEPHSYSVGPEQDEDCLFATAYIPQTAGPASRLPIFTWLHGGSFVQGSAAAPGLNGARLAVQGNMIVVVLQYRLGVLGFLPPALAETAADPNLGLRDVILGLRAIKRHAPGLRGDATRVTLGGQSSGAGLIRALWGAPEAAGLFRAAILQSDPMYIGFASQSITTQLQAAFYSQDPMAACRLLSCLQAISLADLLAAQSELVAIAPQVIEGINVAEVIRPTFGTASLPRDPTALLAHAPYDLTLKPDSLPLLITIVKNEAGSVTQSLFPGPVPPSIPTLGYVLSSLIGAERAASIIDSPAYSFPPANEGGEDSFRELFERIVSDGVWKCPNLDAARQWAGAGGNVWVGEWTQGSAYPSNQIPGGYCSKEGNVCHEDDIYPTFHYSPDTSPEVASVEDDVAAKWIAFIHNMNPNIAPKEQTPPPPPGSIKNGPTPRPKQPPPSPPGPPAGRPSPPDPSGKEPERPPGHPPAPGSGPTPPPPPPSHPVPKAHPALRPETRAGAPWKRFAPDSSAADIYAIGGGSVSGCSAEGIWGKQVQYDWQLYG